METPSPFILLPLGKGLASKVILESASGGRRISGWRVKVIPLFPETFHGVYTERSECARGNSDKPFQTKASANRGEFNGDRIYIVLYGEVY